MESAVNINRCLQKSGISPDKWYSCLFCRLVNRLRWSIWRRSESTHDNMAALLFSFSVTIHASQPSLLPSKWYVVTSSRSGSTTLLRRRRRFHSKSSLCLADSIYVAHHLRSRLLDERGRYLHRRVGSTCFWTVLISSWTLVRYSSFRNRTSTTSDVAITNGSLCG